MQTQEILQTIGTALAVRGGQLNLFTGEPEPNFLSNELDHAQGWLFDPDWNLVLPDNVAGREIFIDEGVALSFPLMQSDVIKEPRLSGILAVTEPPDVSKTADSAQVIISGFGIFLGKKSERLQVKTGKKAIYEFPLFRISEVVVASKGVSLSSDLIKEFCERGIRLSFGLGVGYSNPQTAFPVPRSQTQEIANAVTSPRTRKPCSLETGSAFDT